MQLIMHAKSGALAEAVNRTPEEIGMAFIEPLKIRGLCGFCGCVRCMNWSSVSTTVAVSTPAACRRQWPCLRSYAHTLYVTTMVSSDVHPKDAIVNGVEVNNFVIHGLPMEALLEARRAPHQD